MFRFFKNTNSATVKAAPATEPTSVPAIAAPASLNWESEVAMEAAAEAAAIAKEAAAVEAAAADKAAALAAKAAKAAAMTREAALAAAALEKAEMMLAEATASAAKRVAAAEAAAAKNEADAIKASLELGAKLQAIRNKRRGANAPVEIPIGEIEKAEPQGGGIEEIKIKIEEEEEIKEEVKEQKEIELIDFLVSELN